MPLKCALLKQLRKETINPDTDKPASLAYISDITGVNEATICRMERDETFNPTGNTLKKIANYYQVDINDLI